MKIVETNREKEGTKVLIAIFIFLVVSSLVNTLDDIHKKKEQKRIEKTRTQTAGFRLEKT